MRDAEDEDDAQAAINMEQENKEDFEENDQGNEEQPQAETPHEPPPQPQPSQPLTGINEGAASEKQGDQGFPKEDFNLELYISGLKKIDQYAVRVTEQQI